MRHRIGAMIAAGLAVGSVSAAIAGDGGSVAPEGTLGPFLRVGKEFWANSITRYEQEQPTVAGLSDGNFVVAWRDGSGTAPDTDNGAIRARIFTPKGGAVAKEFLVNSVTRYDQGQPKAAAYQGGFVVVFADDSATGGDASQLAIRGRRFSNAGVAQGKQFDVNQVSQWSQDEPAISILPGHGFIATWDDWSGTGGDGNGDEPAVRGTVFGDGGRRTAADKRLNTTVLHQQYQSAVAGLPNGNAIVVWTDVSQTAPDPDFGPVIRGQMVGPALGFFGKEFVVNQSVVGKQSQPAVASLGNGNYVVVWVQTNSTAPVYQLHGQIWSSKTQKPVGAEFAVPAVVPSLHQRPVVAGFPSGRFVVVWTDDSASAPDFSETGIRAQLYSPTAAKIGGVATLNQVTANRQEEPAVAILTDRDFAVVWTDWSNTAIDQSPNIRGSVFHVNQ